MQDSNVGTLPPINKNSAHTVQVQQEDPMAVDHNRFASNRSASIENSPSRNARVFMKGSKKKT